MRPALITLIHDYQSKVAQACQLLRDRLGLTDLHAFSWRSRAVASRGWLDDAQTISYRFHGIGCCVEFGSVEVDFDFGPGGRHDGFDAWRLSIFAQSISTDSAFADDSPLRAELLDAFRAGELVRDGTSLGSHLFYLPPNRPLLPPA